MNAEQVGRLFQRFYQADSSTTRGAGGTGRSGSTSAGGTCINHCVVQYGHGNLPFGGVKNSGNGDGWNASAAVDAVAASLKEFGWRQPIVVDAERVRIQGVITGVMRKYR